MTAQFSSIPEFYEAVEAAFSSLLPENLPPGTAEKLLVAIQAQRSGYLPYQDPDLPASAVAESIFAPWLRDVTLGLIQMTEQTYEQIRQNQAFMAYMAEQEAARLAAEEADRLAAEEAARIAAEEEAARLLAEQENQQP